MKISVIVTTYNSPLFLQKVTDSLLNKERPADEIIIADDGSDADTARVIDAFTQKAPCPVFHIWQENKGFRASKIRNKAIKKSSGDYIILLDGDCIIDRHFIADHECLAEKGFFIQGKRVHVNRNAVAFFDKDIANSKYSLIKLAVSGKISNEHHLVRLPRYFSISNKRLKGIKSCNMSFFREDILAVNGFNEDYVGWGNEDSDLACRFFKYGLSKKVHPFMAICFHLWHPSNRVLNKENAHFLRAAIASAEFYCKNGLIKEGEQTGKEGDGS